jgi:acetyl esterase/lipase
MMLNLMNGLPDEVPYMYDLAAVATHVHAGGPPALIVQAECDFITQQKAVKATADLLKRTGVPTLYVELPQTEHAWDVGSSMGQLTGLSLPLINSQYGPPTQATIYDVERFLAYIAR